MKVDMNQPTHSNIHVLHEQLVSVWYTGFTILSLMLKMNFLNLYHQCSWFEMLNSLQEDSLWCIFKLMLPCCFFAFIVTGSICVLLTSVWAFYIVCENVWQCLGFLTTPWALALIS